MILNVIQQGTFKELRVIELNPITISLAPRISTGVNVLSHATCYGNGSGVCETVTPQLENLMIP